MGRGSNSEGLDSTKILFGSKTIGLLSRQDPNGLYTYKTHLTLLDKEKPLELYERIADTPSIMWIGTNHSLAYKTIQRIKADFSFNSKKDYRNLFLCSDLKNIKEENFIKDCFLLEEDHGTPLGKTYTEENQMKLLATFRQLVMLRGQKIASGDLLELIKKESEIVNENEGSFLEQSGDGRRSFKLKELFTAKQAQNVYPNKELPEAVYPEYERLKGFVIEDFHLETGTAHDFLTELVSWTDGCWNHQINAFSDNKKLQNDFKEISGNCWRYAAHALAHLSQRNNVQQTKQPSSAEKENLIKLISSLIALKLFNENKF